MTIAMFFFFQQQKRHPVQQRSRVSKCKKIRRPLGQRDSTRRCEMRSYLQSFCLDSHCLFAVYTISQTKRDIQWPPSKIFRTEFSARPCTLWIVRNVISKSSAIGSQFFRSMYRMCRTIRCLS